MTQLRPTYLGMLNTPRTIEGESLRNMSDTEIFAHDTNEIKIIVFLATHASMVPSEDKCPVECNTFFFNYDGEPTVRHPRPEIPDAPTVLRNRFEHSLTQLGPRPTNPTIYALVNAFKETYFAPLSPLSLYLPGTTINNLTVLGQGSISINHDIDKTKFEDGKPPIIEQNETLYTIFKENPVSLTMYVLDRGLPAPNRLDLLDRAPNIVNNYTRISEQHNGYFPLIHDEHTRSFVTAEPPYLYDNGFNRRAVLLSDVYDIIKTNVRNILIRQTGRAVTDAQLYEYMGRHVVLVSNGCRCREEQRPAHGRSRSTERQESSVFPRPESITSVRVGGKRSGGKKRLRTRKHKEVRRKIRRSQRRTPKTITHNRKPKLKK
jgi:hypothetical protein